MFVSVKLLESEETIVINTSFIKFFTNRTAQSVYDDAPVEIQYTKIALKNGEVYNCQDCFAYLTNTLLGNV